MLKFTIRDMFWLTMIVGFSLHAWTERFSRDIAWSRRVRDEVGERALADHRAREAKEASAVAKMETNISNKRADGYARAVRQLQKDLFRARHPDVPIDGDLTLPPECP